MPSRSSLGSSNNKRWWLMLSVCHWTRIEGLSAGNIIVEVIVGMLSYNATGFDGGDDEAVADAGCGDWPVASDDAPSAMMQANPIDLMTALTRTFGRLKKKADQQCHAHRHLIVVERCKSVFERIITTGRFVAACEAVAVAVTLCIAAYLNACLACKRCDHFHSSAVRAIR